MNPSILSRCSFSAVLACLLLKVHAAETHFYRDQGPGSPFHTLPNQAWLVPEPADLDGDGDLDLLAASSDEDADSPALRFFRNVGTPTAPVLVEQTLATLSGVVATGEDDVCGADLDNDADYDLIVVPTDGVLRYYRNTGTPAAPAFTLVSGAASPFPAASIGGFAHLAAADLDHDGDVDFAVGDSALNGLTLLRNTGTPATPAFIKQTYAPFAGITSDDGYLDPAFADTDGDGDLDMLVGLGDEDDGETIRFYRNTGTASAPVFSLDNAPVPFRTLEELVSPVTGDVNGDGILDVVCGQYGSGLRFLRGAPPVAPRFTEVTGAAHPVATASSRYDGSTADLDGDGDKDLVCSNGHPGTLTFMRNTGTATAPAWTAWGTSPAPAVTGVLDTEMADLDADGDIDLAVKVSGGIRYFRNNGTAAAPTFAERTGANNPFAVILSGHSLALADLNADGDLDLVASLLYYENTGTAADPVFTQRTGAQNPLPDLNWVYIPVPELADMDGDGDADLSVATNGELLYFENTGTAASPSWNYRTGTASPFAALPGAFFYSDINVGEWKGGASADLMLTVVSSPAPVGLRFFTGVAATGGTGFAAWQSANFTLPAEAALAAANDDPDNDGVENLLEYALITPPKTAGGWPGVITRNGSGALQLILDVRDDDPALSATGQGGANTSTLTGSFAPVITDPVPGDGLKRWTFTDQPPVGANPRRFLRAVFTLN